MLTTIDAAGRIVVPKAMRDELGLTAGSTVDISVYGAGLAVIPGGRGGRLIEENGHLVITGDGVLTDEMMYALIDAGRR
jgi:AbrB family looped-hinge helix DNA binding protein